MKKIEWNYFVPALALGMVSLAIYINFYDILIPGLPNGSYRLWVGQLFAIPSFLLMFGQIAVSAIFLYNIAAAGGAKVRGTFFRAVLVAAVMTFFFAFTYVMYPGFGPYYYIFFTQGQQPPHVLLTEIAWTVASLLASSLLYSRIYRLGFRKSLFYVALVHAFINVAAS